MCGMKSLVLAVLMSLMVVIGSVQTATAGVEPSPFLPEINQLGAVVNSLDSIHNRIEMVLAIPPPDDQAPGPDVTGEVNRLEAIDNKLVLLNDMVYTIGEEVLAAPADEQKLAVAEAMVFVADAAEGIAGSIDYAVLPDDLHLDFKAALDMVLGSAMDLMATALFWNRQLSEIPVDDCADYENQTDCEFNGCLWLPDYGVCRSSMTVY
jgi:hypothetical protein